MKAATFKDVNGFEIAFADVLYSVRNKVCRKQTAFMGEIGLYEVDAETAAAVAAYIQGLNAKHEAAAQTAEEWKVSVHPMCGGQYAISRKVGERREFAKTAAGVGAVPMIQGYFSRAEAQAAADLANAAGEDEHGAYWSGMSDDIPAHVANAPRVALADPLDFIAH